MGGPNAFNKSKMADDHHFNNSSAVAEMGDRLATVDTGRKVGRLLCPFRGEELGPHLTQCGLRRGLSPYQVASWSIQPFGHNTPASHPDRQAGQRSDSIGRTGLQTSPKNQQNGMWTMFWCICTKFGIYKNTFRTKQRQIQHGEWSTFSKVVVPC